MIGLVGAKALLSGPWGWARILKVALPALAILVAVLWLRSVLNERAALRQWQDDVVAVVRAEVPVERRKAATTKTVADDVRWLGREYRTYRQALEIQSQKLITAKTLAEAARKEAALARKQAVQRNSDSRATRRAILAPGRSTGLSEAEWSKL